MDLQRRTQRFCGAVLVCAILFRLLSGGLLGKMVKALSSPEVVSFLLYLETGRVFRPVQTPEPPPTTMPSAPTEPSTAPTEPSLPPELPVFSPIDAALVDMNNACGYEPDMEALLQKPLIWDLTADAPTVLILHSHATESYTPTEEYAESSPYRTLDTGYNVVSIGERIAEELEQGGIRVIHDKTLHDHPSYSDAYNNSRKAAQKYLEQYPSVCLVLDIHRDAVEDKTGSQLGYTVDVNGQKAAQLMLVSGTDASGLAHPDWQDNLALAAKLHAQLEKNNPGICRPISFRSQRFNQDLSPGALLVEVGAAGNTRQEALFSAELLVQAIVDLAHGTK